jgi:hypothetical protein
MKSLPRARVTLKCYRDEIISERNGGEGVSGLGREGGQEREHITVRGGAGSRGRLGARDKQRLVGIWWLQGHRGQPERRKGGTS